MSRPAKYAIIVAGGSGRRMGSKIPKQFLALRGRPVLMYTLEAFHRYDPGIIMTLVLPGPHKAMWKDLCSYHQFDLPVHVCNGGSSRFQSVKNGLATLSGQGLVAIHDGVRPLIDSDTIERSFNAAERSQSGVAAISIKSSIREVYNGRSRSLDRTKYRIIQTPQTFDLAVIKMAYDTKETSQFTDDASVWEAAGNQVNLIEGSERNLKITTVQDMVVAEMLMNFK